VAVLGNHDARRGAAATRAGLERLGVRVLVNQAARIGPLTLGGLGDFTSEDAKVAPTVGAMRQLGPPYVLLGHQPDSFPDLAPDITLMLAGHTHCGQIALPLIGPIVSGSRYGRRYVCGMVREHGATLIVTGGLGTSDLPIRLGVPTDVWLITLMPAALTPAPLPPAALTPEP
jgi:predicted MPP superfamily phosphohydrolase